MRQYIMHQYLCQSVQYITTLTSEEVGEESNDIYGISVADRVSLFSLTLPNNL